jgi:hypothetical protein
MDPTLDRALSRLAPVAADAIELELGQREHDAQHQAARLRREVETVAHAREGAARLLNAVDEDERVDQRPGRTDRA